MHEKYDENVSYVDYKLFGCPMGKFVRHNFFKENWFGHELADVLLMKLFQETGCWFCDENFEILRGLFS